MTTVGFALSFVTICFCVAVSAVTSADCSVVATRLPKRPHHKAHNRPNLSEGMFLIERLLGGSGDLVTGYFRDL